MEKTKRHIEFIVIDIQNTFSVHGFISTIECDYAISFAWYVFEGVNQMAFVFWRNQTKRMQCQRCHLKLKLKLDYRQCYGQTIIEWCSGSAIWFSRFSLSYLLTVRDYVRGWQYVCIFADNNFNSSSKLVTAKKCWKKLQSNCLFQFYSIEFEFRPITEMLNGVCERIEIYECAFKNLFQAIQLGEQFSFFASSELSDSEHWALWLRVQNVKWRIHNKIKSYRVQCERTINRIINLINNRCQFWIETFVKSINVFIKFKGHT